MDNVPATIEEREDVVVVALRAMDCGTLWKAIEPLHVQGRQRFILDFSGVDYLNSMSIAAIISLRHRLGGSGGRVQLANLGNQTRSIFGILKLDRIFDLRLDLAGAIVAVKQQ